MGAEGGGEAKAKEKEKEKERRPQYTLQALWDGKMSVEDFEAASEKEPILRHDMFERDESEALPVIDVRALQKGSDEVARRENLGRMLEAAKTWGFFKIRHHGVPLEVVWPLTLNSILVRRIQSGALGIKLSH